LRHKPRSSPASPVVSHRPAVSQSAVQIP
jgi:hypothetical protein